MKRAITGMTVLLLAACQRGVIEAELIEMAKDSAASQSGIPATSKFRNVRLSDSEGADLLGTVCGEVNAQSVQGKYVGFTRFIYSPTTGDALIAADPRGQDFGPELEKSAAEFISAFDAMWKETCI